MEPLTSLQAFFLILGSLLLVAVGLSPFIDRTPSYVSVAEPPADSESRVDCVSWPSRFSKRKSLEPHGRPGP